MKAIARILLEIILKNAVVKQFIAAILAKEVTKVLAGKDPAKIKSFIDTANCVLESATVVVGVAKKLEEKLADGTLEKVEADELVAAATAALDAWANAEKTPAAYVALFRPDKATPTV